ncbi:PREDICTED: uncharacterized protein LOC109213986 [Nicotiana attenuata]|uniref:uncharacterized protein LOC109213986 n=1 Tax=Nicotiana attenuata TaxID=49451 RepID=UPI000904D9F1|nr:PREDICTED: uncharacterized protein LOC109213986 [Nicotiana attenuata]
MEALRERNLCFSCHGEWTPGHQCKSRTLNALEGDEQFVESSDEELVNEVIEGEVVEQGEVSLNVVEVYLAQSQVEYFGHVVPGDGVSIDFAKVEAILSWPQPVNIKGLREFLGLTRYYRRFIKNYAWNELASNAFEEVKEAMVKAPALGLPDFSNLLLWKWMLVE